MPMAMQCAHCFKQFPPWEMVYIGLAANGARVYVCMPCHS